MDLVNGIGLVSSVIGIAQGVVWAGQGVRLAIAFLKKMDGMYKGSEPVSW